MKSCPTCGNRDVIYRGVNDDGKPYVIWNCGHQRGGGRPV